MKYLNILLQWWSHHKFHVKKMSKHLSFLLCCLFVSPIMNWNFKKIGKVNSLEYTQSYSSCDVNAVRVAFCQRRTKHWSRASRTVSSWTTSVTVWLCNHNSWHPEEEGSRLIPKRVRKWRLTKKCVQLNVRYLFTTLVILYMYTAHILIHGTRKYILLITFSD